MLSLTASRSDDMGVLLVYAIAFPLAFFGLTIIILEICVNSFIVKIFSSIGYLIIALAIAGEQISKNVEEQYARWLHEYYGFYILVGLTFVIPSIWFLSKNKECNNKEKNKASPIVLKIIKYFPKSWIDWIIIVLVLTIIFFLPDII